MKLFLLILLICSGSTCVIASPVSDALQARYSADEQIAFLAGDEEHVALSYPPAISLRRGVAVILAEGGYQGLTIKSGQSLAQRLRRWGWHVVVVPVPFFFETETSDNAANVTAFTDSTGRWLQSETWQTNLTLLTTGIFNQFSDQSGYKLLICQGMTAAQLLHLTAQSKVPIPDSLVVVAPFWPEATQNRSVTNWIADTATPVLDIAGGLSNHWSEQTTIRRNDNARVGLKLHYRQRQLPVASAGALGIEGHASPFVIRLSNEIYGWTRYLGW